MSRRMIVCYIFCIVFFSTAAIGQQDKPKAENLLPLEPLRYSFVFTEGEREGEKMQLALEKLKEGMWQLQLGNLFVAEIFHDRQGDLRLGQITSPQKNTIIKFQPAILLIPEPIPFDAEIGQQVQVKVIDMKTSEITQQAMVSHRLKSITRTKFYTPAGIYEGYQVQIEQQGSFGMAMLKVDFSGGFVPNYGLVHAYLSYNLNKPLFFGSTETYITELTEPLNE